ncbi:MAG: tetratricopeptide repeat protein [Candidatus Coatesbacteria bacterium]|nr:tetratricopeptide repeat protein [Candidatus Coatesbacteria bacterium]
MSRRSGYDGCAWVALIAIGGIIYLFRDYPVPMTIGAAAIIALIIFFSVKARKRRLERIRALSIDNIDSMNGTGFEHYVAQLLQHQGWSVEVTPPSGDYGADVIATRGNTRMAVQCKRYSKRISRRAVSDVVGAKNIYKCDAAMVVTNSYFTPRAIELARASGCSLVDRDELAKMILDFRRRDSATDSSCMSMAGKQFKSDGDLGAARANTERAMALLESGECEKALTYFRCSMEVFRRFHDKAGEAACLVGIGDLHETRCEHELAQGSYIKAARIYRKMGQGRNLALVSNRIGNAYGAQGDLKSALDCFENALAESKKIGDREAQAGSLNKIGLIHRSRGNDSEASGCFERAFETFHRLGNKPGEAVALINIGNINLSSLQYNRALGCYSTSLSICRELGHKAGEARAIACMANLHAERKDLDRALDLYDRSYKISSQLGDKAGRARLLCSIADLHAECARWTEASVAFPN